ncbi:mCG140541, partial [Mus musculus]
RHGYSDYTGCSCPTYLLKTSSDTDPDLIWLILRDRCLQRSVRSLWSRGGSVEGTTAAGVLTHCLKDCPRRLHGRSWDVFVPPLSMPFVPFMCYFIVRALDILSF